MINRILFILTFLIGFSTVSYWSALEIEKEKKTLQLASQSIQFTQARAINPANRSVNEPQMPIHFPIDSNPLKENSKLQNLTKDFKFESDEVVKKLLLDIIQELSFSEKISPLLLKDPAIHIQRIDNKIIHAHIRATWKDEPIFPYGSIKMTLDSTGNILGIYHMPLQELDTEELDKITSSISEQTARKAIAQHLEAESENVVSKIEGGRKIIWIKSGMLESEVQAEPAYIFQTAKREFVISRRDGNVLSNTQNIHH